LLGVAAAAAAGVVLGAVWLWIALWSRRYSATDPAATMRRVMKLAALTSGAFTLLLAGRLMGLY
jgi:hypothetical protein